ncbi:bacterioferritin-associated ferredoxin [Bradyrhizobium sp. AZCC 2289]
MSQVYASLDSAAKCGRCTHTIKQMIDEADSQSSGCESRE